MTDVGLANRVFAEAFVDELARGGVRHACIAPGSRSTPLALALAGHGAIRPWIHIDERSAAFFALGMARASGEPVAILCSSGTAAANFLPAVVEAFHARIPLVVLTADRPPELRGVGAAQTIDQLRLYGGHVRLFVEMPTPELTDDLLRAARTVAGRAVAGTRGGLAGPVHVNFPFREPLLPAHDAHELPPGIDPVAVKGRPAGAPFVSTSRGVPLTDPGTVAALAADLAGMARGLIVCGPESAGMVGGAGLDPGFAPAVAALAAATGYPILADPLSGVRCGPHDRSLIVDAYDAFLRDEAAGRELAPEVVIQFGAAPTSKPLTTFLGRFPSLRRIVVDQADGWRDPTLSASDVLFGRAGTICHALAHAVQEERVGIPTAEWAGEWTARGAATRAAIAGQLAAADEPFEGRVFAELAELLPSGATLFAGNSMPVRDLDAFFPSSGRAIRCLANRGANGIDGVVSSALGAAAATDGPTVLVIGDLSFYHDLNGLLAAKRHGIR
ncbi:MAG: 2-succinyl-5-enolpyruvyl-6-hydroxy-3-cyclohexene-1-carboxylic-acid synthase, partial [uncultured Thermomicrobiales bacterium]